MKTTSLWRLFAIVVFLNTQGALGQVAPAQKPPAPPPTPFDGTPCIVDNLDAAVPSDFIVRYASGPRHGNWSGRRVRVSVNADGVVEYFIGHVQRSSENRNARDARRELPFKQRKISKEAIKRIYARVIACSFFELNRSYSNPRIRDGNYRLVSVTADGKTHSVSVSYSIVTRFGSIVDVLENATGLRF